MPQEATVRSVAHAYRVIKQMRLQGWDAAEECREAAREAVRAHLRRRMLEARSEFLAQLQAREQVDRANGSYGRHLLTEMGTVLLQVPRTRSWSAAGLLQAYRSPLALAGDHSRGAPHPNPALTGRLLRELIHLLDWDGTRAPMSF